MFELKAATGSRFKVMLKFFRLLAAKKCDVINQSPRSVLVRMKGVAAIVFGKATLKVGSYAHIEALRILLAFQNVHVEHT